MYQLPIQQQAQNQIKIIGNYQYNLRYCLGEGAYGKVFEGIDNKTQLKVAIKKLDIRSFERDTYLRNQIISEIEILKRFNHKNIVKFIDLITTQRSLYIITEFCQNGDLRNLIQHKRLNEEQCIKIIKHIVEGFKELVSQNVIHRDLKPANILIHDGVFKIADFGFAKYVDYSSQQMLRSCVGSPLYMAPQILQRKPYGTKCDIWSLGIIFHEMLFHDVPWKARDERELLHNILTQPFKIRKQQQQPSISKFSEEFLLKTLVVDENDRISWEKIFEMFEHQDEKPFLTLNGLMGKENTNMQFYNQQGQPQQHQQQQVNNKDQNQGNNNNNNKEQNKIKKSIFDKAAYQAATQDNLMVIQQQNTNQQQIQSPIFQQQQILQQQQQLANQQKNQNLTDRDKEKKHSINNPLELKQIEMMKVFISLNTIRQELIFRHFCCVELYQKINQNKQFTVTEMLYDKFILLLSHAVKSQSVILIKELNNQEERNLEMFNNNKEMKALSLSIRRENELYKGFMDDLIENYQRNGFLSNLKGDSEINFIFLAEQNDIEREKLEGLITNYGKDAIREITQELKKKNLDDNMRSTIVSVDYILDIILSKKKLQKGQDVNFDAFHIEKSEHTDLKAYLDKICSRQQLFATSYSIFQLYQ